MDFHFRNPRPCRYTLGEVRGLLVLAAEGVLVHFQRLLNTPSQRATFHSLSKEMQMAKYVVHYELRKGNSATISNKTIECEEERTAIESAEQQAKSVRPDYNFILKKVEKKK